jgi:N-acetylmuramoyl-L-alanine amidase
MYQTVEERSVQKTDEKPIFKKLSGPVLFLIPTILVILLFGAIMGAIAGFTSTPKTLEATDDEVIQTSVLTKNKQRVLDVKSKKVDSKEKTKNTGIDISKPGKINQEIIFKVQVLSSEKPLVSNSPQFKDLKNVWEYEDGGLYKYTVGNKRDLRSTSALQLELREKGFSDAFVVAFKNGKRIPVREALRLLN